MSDLEQVISLTELGKELGKNKSNLMKIVKGHHLEYIEKMVKNERGRLIKERYFTEEVANEIRYPIRTKRIKWNNQKIDAYLTEHNIAIKRNFTTYTRCGDETLSWKCLVEPKHIWETSWTAIYSAGSGCHQCNGYHSVTYDEILQGIKERHITKKLLTTRAEFIDGRTPMEWKCLVEGCDYMWTSTWTKIDWQGTGCHRCSGNERWTTEKMKHRVLENTAFKTIAYLSGEIKHSSKQSLITWQCLNDGCNNTWTTSWYSVNVKSTRCPECTKRGAYCPTLAEKHKEEWLKLPLTIYTLKCWNDEEEFYKIGLTSRPEVRLRFGSKRAMPYTFMVLDEIHTNKYDGSYLESELHDQHKHLKYTPNKYFHGRTECFSSVKHIDLARIDFNNLTVYNNTKKEKDNK